MYNKYYFSRIKLVNKENEAKKGTRIEKFIEIINTIKKNYDHFETKERKFIEKKTVQNIKETMSL